MSNRLTFGPDSGTLTLHTGVTGKAARTGHRLAIGFGSWSAVVTLDDQVPTGVELTVDVESLDVTSGEGGLTPMTAPERLVARTNALKSLKSSKFAQITFVSSDVSETSAGYRFAGDLTICGTTRPHTVEVTVDVGEVRGESPVRHSDFGVKQYSLMMGALKVADEVTVEVAVEVAAV